MKIEQKFQLIDQSKLTDGQKKILADLKRGAKNFKTEDKAILEKAEKSLDAIIEKLKDKNPDAIKPAKRVVPKSNPKSKVSKPVNPNSNRLFDIAKRIRKPNETWADAMSRAKNVQKENNEAVQKTINTEMEKLLAFVKNRKELDGISGTSIKKDAKLEARVKGRRVSKAGWKNQYGESKGGRVYYENRDNRSDRLAPNYPSRNYKLQDGGSLSTADLAGFPTAKVIGNDTGALDGMSGTAYTDLVGETGALSAGELFEEGGATEGQQSKKKKEERLKSALMRDRNNYNHFEDHEKRYSKDKPYRKGYGYADGGLLDENANEVLKKIYEAQKDRKKRYFPEYNLDSKWALLKFGKYYGIERQDRLSEFNPSIQIYDGSDNYQHLGSANSLNSKSVVKKVRLTKKDFEGTDFIGYVFAKGGALSSHGLQEGDTIVKTLSRGVQKIKTKDGKTMYVDLANGYRDDQPPLPFEKGGETSEKKIKWQDIGIGDFAIVKGTKKTGFVIKAYGRKFHLRFNDKSEKTYDASELDFLKNDDYAKGGRVLKPIERYVLEIKGLTGLTETAVNSFIDENNLTENQVLNIVVGLGRKQLKPMDVNTAMIGKKGNKYAVEVLKFAQSDTAMRLEDGGYLPKIENRKHRVN